MQRPYLEGSENNVILDLSLAHTFYLISDTFEDAVLAKKNCHQLHYVTPRNSSYVASLMTGLACFVCHVSSSQNRNYGKCLRMEWKGSVPDYFKKKKCCATYACKSP